MWSGLWEQRHFMRIEPQPQWKKAESALDGSKQKINSPRVPRGLLIWKDRRSETGSQFDRIDLDVTPQEKEDRFSRDSHNRRNPNASSADGK